MFAICIYEAYRCNVTVVFFAPLPNTKHQRGSAQSTKSPATISPPIIIQTKRRERTRKNTNTTPSRHYSIYPQFREIVSRKNSCVRGVYMPTCKCVNEFVGLFGFRFRYSNAPPTNHHHRGIGSEYVCGACFVLALVRRGRAYSTTACSTTAAFAAFVGSWESLVRQSWVVGVVSMNSATNIYKILGKKS